MDVYRRTRNILYFLGLGDIGLACYKIPTAPDIKPNQKLK